MFCLLCRSLARCFGSSHHSGKQATTSRSIVLLYCIAVMTQYTRFDSVDFQSLYC